jgi:hypothetical protein
MPKFKDIVPSQYTQMFLWRVYVVGGVGPNVWDNNFVVEAAHLGDAYYHALPQVNDAGGWITQIDQEN